MMDMFESDTYMELTANALHPRRGRLTKDPFNMISDKETSYVSSNESMKSCEKVRDVRITDLEEKLAMAEDRCSVLRNQVAYMKMLYTNNNGMRENLIEEEDETLKAGGEQYKKIEENIKNSLTVNGNNSEMNELKHREDEHSQMRMPANMTVKPLRGISLTKDAKEAMQMIVNEMTQSVNAMEGGVNIHSNTIEGVVLSTRNRKKRTKKEEWGSPKVKKSSTSAQQVPKKGASRTHEADRKSLASKSKTSVNSTKTAKKRPNSKFNAGSKPRVLTKVQEGPNVQEKPIKSHTPTLQKAGSDTMPRVTSSTYLLPTLSYRMKCVPKSHRMDYSFHRIPFVLGKSTNKSHNLGAKIQETLSLIKLSRKGLQASPKKEELNDLLQNPTGHVDGLSQVESSPFRQTMSSQSKFRSPSTGATNDYKNYQLRTVLMNLHDEFSKMTENYEISKASLKERFDPKLAQHIQNMEEELNAKEIEINAFMNLYNEVSLLKDKLSSTQSGNPPNAIYRPSTSHPESTSTLKMTRLLRRIEQFQSQLKTMSYV